MNYQELLAQSKPGISADGVCAYRISPLEAHEAEGWREFLCDDDRVQDAWVDSLPNSPRKVLFWLPSEPARQQEMFDAFVQGEIKKGEQLWSSRDFDITPEVHTWYDKAGFLQYENRIHVHNFKTGTSCYLIRGETHSRCEQGKRCGLCKHEVVAVLEGLWQNDSLKDCIDKYLGTEGYVNEV